MKKIVIEVIDNCDNCPNFDNRACPCYQGEQTCTLLDRKIKWGRSDYGYGYTIPEDCPLETKED